MGVDVVYGCEIEMTVFMGEQGRTDDDRTAATMGSTAG